MLAASGGLVYSINQLLSLLIAQYRANEEWKHLYSSISTSVMQRRTRALALCYL